MIQSNETLENNRGVSQTPKNWNMLIHVVPSGSKLVIYCLKRISVLMLHSILVRRRVLLAYITLLSLVAGCSRFWVLFYHIVNTQWSYKSGKPTAHQRNAIWMAFRWWADGGRRLYTRWVCRLLMFTWTAKFNQNTSTTNSFAYKVFHLFLLCPKSVFLSHYAYVILHVTLVQFLLSLLHVSFACSAAVPLNHYGPRRIEL